MDDKERQPLLTAAFTEGETTIGNRTFRPLSVGSVSLARQLNLTSFLEEGASLSDAEAQRQLSTFAWMQSEPLPVVLKAVRENRVSDAVQEFEFSMPLSELTEIMRHIQRISAQSAAAAVEVEKKPGSDEKDTPGN